MDDAQAAIEALESAHTARAKLAERATCPAWRHWAFGALMGAVVAAQAAPSLFAIGLEGACAAVAGVMFVTGRRSMGFWANGYRRGRTRPVIAVLLLAFLAIYSGAVWLKLTHGLILAPLAGGAAMLLIATAASYKWQAAYRAELTSAEIGAHR